MMNTTETTPIWRFGIESVGLTVLDSVSVPQFDDDIPNSGSASESLQFSRRTIAQELQQVVDSLSFWRTAVVLFVLVTMLKNEAGTQERR